MSTHFAPSERTDPQKLAMEIDLVSKNPVMSGLLHSVSAVLAVLDENRQVIAINDELLGMIGVEDPSDALGMRIGEALHCGHAHEEPAGCGTTRYCSTCGAAIAMVASLGTDRPVERICALSSEKDGEKKEMALLVRSHPIRIEGYRFLLLFLQDITVQEYRASLERTFFHDVNNMLGGLVLASQLLVESDPSGLALNIRQAIDRLTHEIDIQRAISSHDSHRYNPRMEPLNPRLLFSTIESFFNNHPAAVGKKLIIQTDPPQEKVSTDMSLLTRLVCNMIINAFEASQKDGEVKLWATVGDGLLQFHVWNAQEIPADVARRVFQRNFSTKDQAGRGFGTYSMKFFGEEILGGKVGFDSSATKGTVFTISLPVLG